MAKKILKWVLIVLASFAGGLALFVWWHAHNYDASVTKVYRLPLRELAIASDATALQRGKHLAESLGECTICHGADFGGGHVEPMGPLGHIVIPNATSGKQGRLGNYSNAELARLLRHGVKRDGTTVRLMPVMNISWWPDEDVAALITYLRSLPPKDGNPGVFELGLVAKLLDRFDSIPIDQARRIDHEKAGQSPSPKVDVAYGSFVGTSCRGCHGVTLAGGPIPGAPPDLPVPLNLTRHATGLGGWSYDDFKALVQSGKRKDGRKLASFMPVESLRNMNEVELNALWLYLQSVPPRPWGERT